MIILVLFGICQPLKNVIMFSLFQIELIIMWLWRSYTSNVPHAWPVFSLPIICVVDSKHGFNIILINVIFVGRPSKSHHGYNDCGGKIIKCSLFSCILNEWFSEHMFRYLYWAHIVQVSDPETQVMCKGQTAQCAHRNSFWTKYKSLLLITWNSGNFLLCLWINFGHPKHHVFTEKCFMPFMSFDTNSQSK